MGSSPLASLSSELGARFVEFAGWQMPVQFEGVLAEHRAVRAGVGVFDVSHLGRFRFTGGPATRVVRELLCNDITAIQPGRAQYTMMLNTKGGVEDDIIVWRLGEDDYLVLPNGVNDAKVRRAFSEAARGKSIIEPLRDTTALLAVQGPQAPDLLREVVGTAPGRFRVEQIEVDGVPGWVAGTGYTGERGGELVVPAAVAEPLTRRLLEAGAVPCGLGARDTLRLEMGYPLWGQDLDPSITPLEADLAWVVDWDHEFVGRRPLQRQKRKGVDTTKVSFVMKGPQIPRTGYPLRAGDSEGKVTSGNFSPMLEQGIGMGYISPAPVFHRFSRRDGDPHPQLEVEVRGAWLPVSIRDLPFIERP